jgi:hypothetical protein
MKSKLQLILLSVYLIACLTFGYAATRIPTDQGPAVWGTAGIFVLSFPWCLLSFVLGGLAIYILIAGLFVNAWILWRLSTPIETSDNRRL